MVYRIFLVEDHPVMLEGFARMLDSEPDVEVCGQARSGTEALRAIAEAKPDLALVDLSIPDMNGLDVIKQLRTLDPQLATLVVTAHSEALYGERALRAGAKGFISKDASSDAILDAIRTVLRGDRYLSPALRDHVEEQAANGQDEASPLTILSDRELEVFEHFGRGYSTVKTAEALFISPKTVETHRANIKRKLGLERANEVIQRATLWVESLRD
ncbi:MAG: response regulator transcription factor [Rhodothermaceae bacterium]|nr:response regulator transcription factor [Rhodothermaceae bacterium]